ncbi:hypothetical protein FHX59_001809 [Paraburkholderia silvatlantica]|uniref:Uncharacterized protein n=1 Tax=Paraburkholderia silvatlantica TaxID=321895 RepID=A0ABR6FIZ1_9BURK|nr:hypothetical protein [Paraburkholderia silvatlantica]
MQRFAVFFRMEPLTRFAIRQQLCDLGQDFKMLLRRLFGHEQEDQERDGLTVWRFEGDWLSEAHEGGLRLLQALDAAVRDRDAFAEARGAEALAREKIIGNRAAGDAVLVFEDQASLFEDAFLAGDGQADDDVLDGKYFG